MKKILGAILILSASASHAGHLDVIAFTMNEDCSLGQYLEIVDDFNEWGEAYGYQAEVAAPTERFRKRLAKPGHYQGRQPCSSWAKP